MAVSNEWHPHVFVPWTGSKPGKGTEICKRCGVLMRGE